MASDKCAQSFCSQKGSKSASHRFLLIFTHTWISPNPGATRTNGLGELDSFVFFFSQKIFHNLCKRYMIKKIHVDWVKCIGVTKYRCCNLILIFSITVNYCHLFLGGIFSRFDILESFLGYSLFKLRYHSLREAFTSSLDY